MFSCLKFISLFRMLFGVEENLCLVKIEQMGLLAVKIAQMYAVRSDLLGVEKCKKLQGLYEKSSPILWSEAEALLKDLAPSGLWRAVAELDPEPLSVASLGQVHRAVLMTGEEVVVKFIKPKARESFESDLRILKGLARGMVFFYPKLKRLADPVGTIDTIARLTRTEFNLLNEDKGSQTLAKLRGADYLEVLHFPKIYRELSNQNVLVSEYIPHLSVMRGCEDGSYQYEQLLQLFRVQGYFLFLKGQFHGDLHPGNIFFCKNELWFLDNANIEKVDVSFTKGLLNFLSKLGEGEYLRAAQEMELLSLRPPKDSKQYYMKFQTLYAGFRSGKSSLTTQMMETVKLCVHSGMEFPVGAFSVIKSLMYLDGIALRCAPDADLLKEVLKFSEVKREL